MDSYITMYISLVTTSGVLSVFLAIYAYLKREEISGARTFILMSAAQAIYIFGFAFELASDTLQEIDFWISVEYIGMPFAPVLGLLLALRYIGRRVSKTAVAMMFVIPSVTLAMVSTNDYHHLFYKSVYLREGTATPLADVVIAEWYIVHGAYTFGCLFAAAVLYISQWGRTKKAFRPQLATLICGQIIPIAGAFLYLMGVTPGGMDPVPIITCFTSAMYVWAMISARMLTIVPIAKESIFESMKDGVIVLDSADRLIDFNGAVSGMIPALHPGMIGQTLDEAWIQLTGAAFPVTRRLDGTHDEMKWTANGEVFYYQVRSSLVRGRNGEQIGSLVMLIDITEQKRLQEQLKRLAYYDGLTQIFNRTHFLDKSKEMLDEAKLHRGPVSFILFDIDHFKSINDTYGHDIGDQAIVHVVTVCRRFLSPDMLFARYGGEEFVLALPSASIQDAGKLAERIRAALVAEPMISKSGRIAVTSSFGVAQFTKENDTLESLLKDADEALYESKRNGRNMVRLRMAR